MQTPGSFLFAYSLAIQPRTNWTSWLPFFAAGLLQFVLLVLCTYFICSNPALDNDVIHGSVDERERLLGSSDEAVPITYDHSPQGRVQTVHEQEASSEDTEVARHVIVGTRQGSPDANSKRSAAS